MILWLYAMYMQVPSEARKRHPIPWKKKGGRKKGREGEKERVGYEWLYECWESNSGPLEDQEAVSPLGTSPSQPSILEVFVLTEIIILQMFVSHPQGNWTQGLCKSNKCSSLPNQLSRPTEIIIL